MFTILFYVFIAFWMGDYALTTIGIKNGAVELNPILRIILGLGKYGLLFLFIFKALLAVIIYFTYSVPLVVFGILISACLCWFNLRALHD